MSILFCNLYFANKNNKLLAIPFDNNFYSYSNGIRGYAKFNYSRDIKEIANLLDKYKLIKIHRGVKNKYKTLLQIKPKLSKIFNKYLSKESDISQVKNNFILQNKNKQLLNYKKVNKKSDLWGIKMIFNVNQNKKMLDALNKINFCYKIGLKSGTKYRLTNDDLFLTCDPKNNNPKLKKVRKHIISLINKSYKRIFNTDFDRGGRYYGHFIQALTENERENLSIQHKILNKNYKVTELDFTSLHAKLLYDLIKKPLPFDPYELNGYPRQDMKILFQIMLNGLSVKTVGIAFIKNRIADNIYYDAHTTLKMMQIIKDAHKPLSEFFLTGCGICLQRIDSEIASLILKEFIKQKKPIFPVHDSFVVKREDKNLLKDTMKLAYFTVMQANPPDIH